MTFKLKGLNKIINIIILNNNIIYIQLGEGI